MKETNGFNEMLDELKEPIDRGHIEIATHSEQTEDMVIARYPFLLCTIDWDRVPNAKSAHAEIDPDKPNSFEPLRRLLSDYATDAAIAPDSPVIFMGDNMTIDLKMSFETLLNYCHILFNWPQHHHVVPPDASWCIEYLMEGNLSFGFAPNTRRDTGKGDKIRAYNTLPCR